MQRISIVGNPGAGKTTFSRALGSALEIEVVELDRLFGHLDGITLTRSECEARLAEVLTRPCYILDGGFAWTYGRRIASCDTLIWMDQGMGRHFVNVLRRSWSAAGSERPTPLSARGLRGRFPPLEFWVGFLREHGLGIDAVRRTFANPPDGVGLVALRSYREADAFLAGHRK